MKRVSAIALLCLALAGCGPLIERYTPLPASENGRGYSITAVYGPLDGTQEEARTRLGQEAERLCKGAYKRADEQNIERVTAWGSPNGQYSLIWEVRCSS